MRIRKKKNLESRLNKCTNLVSINCYNKDFRETEKNYIDFDKIFKNLNPTHLEIGCGKGQFVCQMAKRHHEINFIAVEKCSNVIVQACENALKENLDNIIFIKMDAEYINNYIKDNIIDRLYLNFSCPFPKKKHESHRLTNYHFLLSYKKILTENAEIWQKTDNMHFFEYSIEQYTKARMVLSEVTFDLHNTDFKDNIITEYENRFISQGLPIYRLVAKF
ncbi:MAG: tRNA (guanosine(46)-N7)-methyltransferase TrmB [Acutalibacteraceae bacterium]|nr:tRNA (guanosine(46)-N7)-methyltransferase TrmB [Acutalibacteraceae bacterium]